jgi:ketosteroid isomerase-like protein
MCEQNVELVTALQPSGVDLVEANQRGRGPFDELPASMFAKDFEAAFIARESGAESARWKGIEGVAAAWRDWLEAWESYEIRAEEVIDAGDRVVVFARIRGRTRRDHVAMEHAPAAIWTVRDGAVSRVEFYLDRAEALAAAGLAG